MIKEDSTPYSNYEQINHSKIKIINSEDFTKSEIEVYQNRIINYAQEYVREAHKRGIYLINPIYRYKFSMYQKNLTKEYVGHCNDDDMIIYLRPDFHISTFLHELGHCDFGYSHLNDKKYLINNYSYKIMHWRFKDEAYHTNKEAILDHFFNPRNHYAIDSESGTTFHLIMELEIFFRKTYDKIASFMINKPKPKDHVAKN